MDHEQFALEGVQTFVSYMNDKAVEMNLYSTSFSNPCGIKNQRNVSTAFDMANLSVQAMRNQAFAKIVK